MSDFTIGERFVGLNTPCYIIAEAGVNHNGDLDVAFQLVDAAVAAGADSIKFQTFKTEKLVTRDAAKAQYQKETTGSDETQYEMLKRLELSEAAHTQLQAYCEQQGIMFLSSPFDETSADLLDEMGVPAFKLGSGEITNIPLLQHIAHKQKPMIISTGMSYLTEIEAALNAIEAVGNPPVALLHCVSNYPAEYGDSNLRVMETMRRAFDVPVGYSDHTLGINIPIAAVALGATIIEKHFTLDKNARGPDHRASLEPYELKLMVDGIRQVESALGHGRKIPTQAELETAKAARKSLVMARDLSAGTRLSQTDITLRRPGTGLPPEAMPYIVGRTLKVSVEAGTVITLENLE